MVNWFCFMTDRERCSRTAYRVRAVIFTRLQIAVILCHLFVEGEPQCVVVYSMVSIEHNCEEMSRESDGLPKSEDP